MLRFVPDPDHEIGGSENKDHLPSCAHLEGYLDGYSIDYIQVNRVNDKMEGKGIIYFQVPHEDETMECEYSNNKKNGKARLYDKNRICTFSGTFINDIIEGPCEMYEDGILTFSGTISNNNINGYGYNQSKGILIYEGYYSDGKRNGIGREYAADGSVLSDCVYKKGKKLNATYSYTETGDCILYLYDEHDTLTLLGTIDPKTAIMNGLGCHFHTDGTISDVVRFSKDSVLLVLQTFNGEEMTEYDKNGDISYKGHYHMVNNLVYKREGEGIEYNGSQEVIYRGSYKNGERSGKGKEYQKGVCIYDGEWEKNQRNGKGCSYHISGTVEFNGIWKNGQCIEKIQTKQEETENPYLSPTTPNDYPYGVMPNQSSLPYGVIPDQTSTPYGVIPDQTSTPYGIIPDQTSTPYGVIPDQSLPYGVFPSSHTENTSSSLSQSTEDPPLYSPLIFKSVIPHYLDESSQPKLSSPIQSPVVTKPTVSSPKQKPLTVPKPPPTNTSKPITVPKPPPVKQQQQQQQPPESSNLPVPISNQPQPPFINNPSLPLQPPFMNNPSLPLQPPFMNNASIPISNQPPPPYMNNFPMPMPNPPPYMNGLSMPMPNPPPYMNGPPLPFPPLQQQGMSMQPPPRPYNNPAGMNIPPPSINQPSLTKKTPAEIDKQEKERVIKKYKQREETEEEEFTEEEFTEETQEEEEEEEFTEEEFTEETQENEEEEEFTEEEFTEETQENEEEEEEFTEEEEEEVKPPTRPAPTIPPPPPKETKPVVPPKETKPNPPSKESKPMIPPKDMKPIVPPKESKPLPSQQQESDISSFFQAIPSKKKEDSPSQSKYTSENGKSTSTNKSNDMDWDDLFDNTYSYSSSDDDDDDDDSINRFFESQSTHDSSSSSLTSSLTSSVTSTKEAETKNTHSRKKLPPLPPTARQRSISEISNTSSTSANTTDTPSKPLPSLPPKQHQSKPLPIKPSKSARSILHSSSGLSISARSLMVDKEFYGAIEYVITVDEMERYFTFFSDIRTRSNYLTLNEVYSFYKQINRGKPMITQVLKLIIGDKRDRIFLKEFALLSHLLYLYSQGKPLPTEIPSELENCAVFRYVSDELSDIAFNKPPYFSIYQNKADTHYSIYSQEPMQIPFNEIYEIKSIDTLIDHPSHLSSIQTSHRVVLQDIDLYTLSSFEYSHLPLLQSLVIAHNIGSSCQSFKISDMSSLEQIIIGEDCFTICRRCDMKNAFAYSDRIAKTRKIFLISDCPLLHTLSIGNNSFTDFTSFSLSNLPFLQTINIGTTSGMDSYENRSYAFFKCKEIQLLNLPALSSISFGNYAFYYCESAMFQNLGKLEKIVCGSFSFFKTSYLSLVNLPILTEVTFQPFSFYSCEAFNGVDISSISSVTIDMNCFYLLKEITKKNISVQLSMELNKERKVRPKIITA